MEKGFEALEFPSFMEGNYGAGNYRRVEYLVGRVLYASPVVRVLDEARDPDDWHIEEVAVKVIATPGNGLILALLRREEGKAGRGCQSYLQEDWQLVKASSLWAKEEAGQVVEALMKNG